MFNVSFVLWGKTKIPSGKTPLWSLFATELASPTPGLVFGFSYSVKKPCIAPLSVNWYQACLRKRKRWLIHRLATACHSIGGICILIVSLISRRSTMLAHPAKGREPTPFLIILILWRRLERVIDLATMASVPVGRGVSVLSFSGKVGKICRTWGIWKPSTTKNWWWILLQFFVSGGFPLYYIHPVSSMFGKVLTITGCDSKPSPSDPCQLTVDDAFVVLLDGLAVLRGKCVSHGLPWVKLLAILIHMAWSCSPVVISKQLGRKEQNNEARSAM